MKFSHFTDTIILFGNEFDNFQTKLIRVGHNLHLKLGVQVLGCRSKSGQIHKTMEFDRSFIFSIFHFIEKIAKNNRTLVTQSAVNLN